MNITFMSALSTAQQLQDWLDEITGDDAFTVTLGSRDFYLES